MAKTITTIDPSSDHFLEWLAMSNTMATTFAKVVTVASNTAGDTTTGNAAINGTLSANYLIATLGLTGGTIEVPAALPITSNVIISGSQANISANVYIVSANVAVYSNSAIRNLWVQNDGTTSNVTISGNNLIVSSNATFNGVVMKMPSGNTGTSSPVTAPNSLQATIYDISMIYRLKN